MNERDLTDKIIGCAMRVHLVLSCGFVESIYHNSLLIELTKAGLSFETQKTITVRYEEAIVAEFSADLIVEKKILLELKACQSVVLAHEVQVVNYLTATGLELGLLINFGVPKLQVKRKTRIYTPTAFP